MPTNLELAKELSILKDEIEAFSQEADNYNLRLGVLEDRVSRFIGQVQNAINIVEDRGEA